MLLLRKHYTLTHFFCPFFFLACLIPSAAGQSEIGGIINWYGEVTGTGDCPNTIQLADLTGFAVGQRVLLLAMQGGEMAESNGNEFGEVGAENLAAGSYIWSTIEEIQGNEIFLDQPVGPGFDFTQAVQLIGVPTYEDALVTTDLETTPWDGSTGGVLALEVSGTLELQADLNAAGAGFRGGQSVQAAEDNCNVLTAASNYFYEAGNWRGAPKGEGIIPLISGKELGRGPQSNGGGGANTHNAGGGGGANRSRGGQGGENREPSFGGCDGFFPGLGGKPLHFGPDRWFLGGGGGAGHRNNDVETSGGNGGGLVLVVAGNLNFSGGSIQANGTDGLSSIGDGGGGGGAGGTIILQVDNISGTPVISARGGNGGNARNENAPRCFGPGGGGSGGQVYSSVAVSPDLAGGLAGISRDGSCPEGNNGAVGGEDGNWLPGGLKTPGAEQQLQILDISPDTSICPGAALSLRATVNEAGMDVNYQWLINSDNSWITLEESTDFQGTQTSELQINNLEEDGQFQLVVDAECSAGVSSEPILVSIAVDSGGPVANFGYELDGFSAQFDNTSQSANAYEWRIREIPSYSSTEADPIFTFPDYGSYEVVLWAIGPCGIDSTAQVIEVGGPPRAAFESISSGTNCAPVTVEWVNRSEGVYDTYFWEFPGGLPATSQDPNPVVIYETPGEFDVRLTVSGELGSHTQVRENAVKIFSVPQPEFSYQINGLTVSFTNMSAIGDKYIWNFGDGAVSREENPDHTYSEPGAYDVTLNLQNGGCGRSITYTILVFPTGIVENELQPYVKLYPNPTSGPLYLETDTPALFPLEIYIYAPTGQKVAYRKLTRPEIIYLSDYPAGVYWIMARSPLGLGYWSVLRQ